MSNNELEVKIKIGEIEFYAKGQTADVEAQRQNFTSIILPAAVDAIKSSRLPQTYIEEASAPALSPVREAAVLDVNADLSALSVNEFVKSKGFRTQEDIAIGLIYYYEVCKNAADFSTEDLKGYFKESKNTMPGNPSMIVNRLFSKGFIMNGDDKKRYYLTQTGIDYVNNYVPKETKAKKTVSSKLRKKQVKAESAYANLSADDLNLRKYPEIKSFKDFKDQMMLVLYIVKEEGHGDQFSTFDIQTLMTDVLGFPATANQINGVIRRNATWFKSVKDSEQKCTKQKLLNGAIDYAKSLIESKANDNE